MSRIYGYVRSGRDRPRRATELIAPQQEAINAWAVREQKDVTIWRPDLRAGAALPLFQRPRGKELQAALRHGDTIVAARFDRLFGDPLDAHKTLVHARQLGIHVRALDVADGRHDLERNPSTLAILSAFTADSDFQRSLDQKAVKQDQAQQGRYRGGTVPFGSRVADDGALVRDEAQQEFISELRRCRRQGLTYEKLATFSEAHGHSLTAAGIRKILNRSAKF